MSTRPSACSPTTKRASRSLRDREIVTDRVCARRGAQRWGARFPA